MKFAFFKHRDAGGPLWPDSFAKALTNGNELMSRNFGAKFGLLEAGYKADLTICDYNSPTPLLADDLAGHIAFGMGSGSVHSVMVNGVIVVVMKTVSLTLIAIPFMHKPEKPLPVCDGIEDALA